MGQVLDNLLSNASKYSPESSTIRVTASQDDIYVAISVTDEGRGVSVDHLPHLFKKFSRVDEENVEHQIGGDGLGLAICKGIVEAHGGRIWAESDGLGRGTRFTFTTPVSDEAATDPAQQSTRVDPVARPGESVRILAVDDEPQVLRFLQHTLSEAGYEPFGTANPDEMAHLLEIEQPDLVLLDLMLPGTNGFELMERIRGAFQSAGHLPVRARQRGEHRKGPRTGSR